MLRLEDVWLEISISTLSLTVLYYSPSFIEYCLSVFAKNQQTSLRTAEFRVPHNRFAFLPLYSSVGDTVCMTLFVVPFSGTSFWPSALTHPWTPMSASQANTHCQSFLPSDG